MSDRDRYELRGWPHILRAGHGGGQRVGRRRHPHDDLVEHPAYGRLAHPQVLRAVDADHLGLRFDVISWLEAEADDTRQSLRAETRWPRGLGLLGRLVERAILNPREAERELNNLKALVEGEAKN